MKRHEGLEGGEWIVIPAQAGIQRDPCRHGETDVRGGVVTHQYVATEITEYTGIITFPESGAFGGVICLTTFPLSRLPTFTLSRLQHPVLAVSATVTIVLQPVSGSSQPR